MWPAYSPGGTMIAFTRDMVAGTDVVEGDIFVMQANGTGLKRLTTTTTHDAVPDWTPDGSRLVFTCTGLVTAISIPWPSTAPTCVA